MLSDDEKRHITPEEAVLFLQKKGLKVSEKEAQIILDFLYKIAILQHKQFKAKKYEKS